MTSLHTDTEPATIDQIVDLHLAAYAHPDPAQRAELVRQAWAPDGSLVDPPLDGTGHEAIAALADAVLAHFPGHSFRRTSAVDAHHCFARYSWELVAPDGAVTLAGLDVVEVAADGRLQRVVGFFGDLVPVPAGHAPQ